MNKIQRKSATIKIKITGGKSPQIDISTYSSLSIEESDHMNNLERANYMDSEVLTINNQDVKLKKLMYDLQEYLKIYTENSRVFSVLYK